MTGDPDLAVRKMGQQLQWALTHRLEGYRADAPAAARQAALDALAVAADVAGGVDSITRIIRVNVFVASAAGFTDQATVANGASALLVDIFGDLGRHTRCALGAAELPLNSPIELDMIVELRA